jgi:hypothetical protein
MNDRATALERYLPIRLSVVASRLTRVIWRVYGPRFGLSAPEWRAIAVLARFGAMPLVDVMHRAELG